jgi:hypothetical protein
MCGGQVDLVVSAIQAEPDGALRLASVQIVGEDNPYLLRHVRSFPLLISFLA